MTTQLSLFSELPVPAARERSAVLQPHLRQAAASYVPSVHDLPAAERPSNRLQYYGAGALGTAELLAVLLGTPMQLTDAQRLLQSFEGPARGHRPGELAGAMRPGRPGAGDDSTHQGGLGIGTPAPGRRAP